MSKRKPDPNTILKLCRAATRLDAAYRDLPEFDRPWPRGEGLRLLTERPDGLTAARKEHGATKDAAAAARRAQLGRLGKLLDDAGCPDSSREVYSEDVEAYYLPGRPARRRRSGKSSAPIR